MQTGSTRAPTCTSRPTVTLRPSQQNPNSQSQDDLTLPGIRDSLYVHADDTEWETIPSTTELHVNSLYERMNNLQGQLVYSKRASCCMCFLFMACLLCCTMLFLELYACLQY